MRADAAIDLINNMVFRPGWRFIATDRTNQLEEGVTVRVEYPACETNRDQAKEGYPVMNDAQATFPIMVSTFQTPDELARAILHIVGLIDSHEAREALRYKPTYDAPFHPHRADGITNWHKTEHVCEQWKLFAGDMHFGIA